MARGCRQDLQKLMRGNGRMLAIDEQEIGP